MNELTTLLLYLLGAASLGCIIGWCISSIMAGRAENRLTSQFAREKRALKDKLDEAQDESARLNGLLNKAKVSIRNHENQAFMSKQTVNADVQHQLDTGKSQINELKTDLERHKEKVQLLEKEASDQASKHAEELASALRASGMRSAADTSTAEGLPVLLNKRGPEVLPGNYDGFDATAADSTHWEDIDTEKYDFLSAGSNSIEVDEDIQALSETGVFEAFRENRPEKSAQSPRKENTRNPDGPGGAMQNGAKQEFALSDVDLARPDSEAFEADTDNRTEGLFSRFNKRNK